MNVQLLSGPVPWILLILGVAGLGFLLWGRSRAWWTLKVPLSVGAGVLVVALVELIIDHWLDLFYPEGMGPVALSVVGVMVAALLLALLRETAWKRRWIALLAVVGVVLGGVSVVNQSFHYYPDLNSLIGKAPDGVVPLPPRPSPGPSPGPSPNPVGPLIDTWKPPADLPAKGTLSSVMIPGTVSGWNTGQRDWVYLPPAAYDPNIPDLPVIMLMPGDPGSPDQWALNLKLAELMDTFAAAHKGLAPIVVVPDTRGTGTDPECVDSKVGKVFTYVSVDVPNWVKANVPHASSNTLNWTVGGLSAGGTCGLILTVNAPTKFSTFLNLAGLNYIALNSVQDAVTQLFGGSQAAYEKVNPADVLKREKFPKAAGFIGIGDGDGSNRANVDALRSLATAAGMTIEFRVVPGGHSGLGFSNAFVAALPWISRRFGLIG